MDFSESELKSLLNIIKSNKINRDQLTETEQRVIKKMKKKYGSDYLNQLNIIRNKYNNLYGGAFTLKKKTTTNPTSLTKLKTSPIVTHISNASKEVGTATVKATQNTAIGTVQGLLNNLQQKITGNATQTPSIPTKPETESQEALKTRISQLEEELQKSKSKTVLTGGNRIIVENSLYTIDESSE